jgi:aerobic carbon-monoxide dehydrogenase medium subunit
MAPFDLLSPRTVEEALATIRSYPADEVAVLAGGTDLLLDLDGERSAPRAVVSLRWLPWRTLDWNGPALTIGSTLPLRALETDPDLKRRLPALYEAVRAVGGVALRNRATLGGNLGRAAPASDLIPVLLVLDAEVELVGPGGARTMSADRFVRGSRNTELGRAELIRSVRIPEARPSAYLWQRVRPANDISQLSVAVAYVPRDRSWRVALGGIPPRPVRVPEAEEALVGPRPSVEAVRTAADRAAAHAALVTDRRASDDYRRRVAGVLLARAVRSAIARGEGFP